MPITQENALSHLPLLECWLGAQVAQEEGAEPWLVGGGSLCRAAICKLVEYIQLNFTEGDGALPAVSFQEGVDAEVRAVSLTKVEGDRDEFGLSFGNIPIFGDPEGRKKGGRRRRRKGDMGPVLDVGCIWVTEVRKMSPAARCGEIKLRDELLSLNGQLMVGVDVTGARGTTLPGRLRQRKLDTVPHSIHLAPQSPHGAMIGLTAMRNDTVMSMPQAALITDNYPLPPHLPSGETATASALPGTAPRFPSKKLSAESRPLA
ncbi:hypothetical protein AAFF_G00315410 [Aldrovandia affinis]|uniref:PDZ domain-containing protein n=1 Tax=Aldrovandia affinis TaxID=143900 RepID=A0AAD7SPT9_9TELE|nr:hypothetical protein AAFF_G00315410 [Aldrovandia affinis]